MHRESVRAALAEVERYTQAGTGNVHAPETTGQVAATTFEQDTAGKWTDFLIPPFRDRVGRPGRWLIRSGRNALHGPAFILRAGLQIARLYAPYEPEPLQYQDHIPVQVDLVPRQTMPG